MRVLLTGGAGFIGTKLSSALANEGAEVTVLDNLHPQIHGDHASPDPRLDGAFVRGDVTDRATMVEVAEAGHDLIVHLAAETGTRQSLDEASRHGLVNVVGTTRLVDALTEVGRFPEHLVLLSSRAVYGEGDWEIPGEPGAPRAVAMRMPRDLSAGRWLPSGIPEGSIPLPSSADRTAAAPTSVYGATKLAQEHVLRAWCVARDVSLSILRLQNVYGPGQSPRNPYTGVMTLFARLALAGDPVPIYEDGNIMRDFVHVGDVVAAIMAACGRVPSMPRILDIGSGRATTILAMANTVTTLAGGPAPIITGEYRAGDVRAACCDISRAERELEWQPSISLQAGIKSLLQWLG